MKIIDIVDVLVSAIDKTIFESWKHEGFIGGMTSAGADFVVDGKEYVLTLREVRDGEHWSEEKDHE